MKYRRVALEIVAAIRAGKYQPGDKLPSVKDMSEEHGNSTAKRVLRWLQENGWATSEGTAGTFVADPLPSGAPSLEERVAALEAWRVEVEQDRHSNG